MSKYSDKKKRRIQEGLATMDSAMGDWSCEEHNLSRRAGAKSDSGRDGSHERKKPRKVKCAADGIASAIRGVVDAVSALDDAIKSTRMMSRVAPLSVRNSLNAVRLKLSRLQARVLEFGQE